VNPIQELARILHELFDSPTQILRLNFAHLFQVFIDTEPLARSDIEEVQQEWAKFFLKLEVHLSIRSFLNVLQDHFSVHCYVYYLLDCF